MSVKPFAHGRAWSEEDDLRLVELYDDFTLRQIAVVIGRSRGATALRATQLGLNRRVEACKQCDKALPPPQRSSGRPRYYCDPECRLLHNEQRRAEKRNARKRTTCLECDGPMPATHRWKFCSDECAHTWWAGRRTEERKGGAA
jgi:hypothetical protein